MTRHPDTYTGAGTRVYGDVHDAESLSAALAGCDAAYYLVHSLDDADFERDAEAARAFAEAAAEAGLGASSTSAASGDDDDELSAHLRSRREVEQPARPRAGAGHRAPGRASSSGTAASPGRSPASWSSTCRPWSPRGGSTPGPSRSRSHDVIRYLVGVLEPARRRGRIFEIGGPDVLAYAEMMRRVAAASTIGRCRCLPVPLLTPAAVLTLAVPGHRRGHRRPAVTWSTR